MLFYDIMNYNYPEDKDYFSINKDLLKHIKNKPNKKKHLSNNISRYVDFIKKYQKIFKYIPFIKSVYISNSISFKSVHNKSDIDLFIVIENNRLHIWRLITKILLHLMQIEWNHLPWKFCTWFWVTEQSVDLYPIIISPIDIYLAYWIAHLQPIYSISEKNMYKIYEQNKRVKEIIPNYNYKPKNIININPIIWTSYIKKMLEKFLSFNFLNVLIWKFRKIKMLYKQKKSIIKKKDLIISDDMLKFFSPDIRKIVYLKYKSLQNNKFQNNKSIKFNIKNLNKKKFESLF